MVVVPAALFTRPQLDRTGLLKTQGPHETAGAENRRGFMERSRRNPRAVLTKGMCKLL